MIDVDFSEMFAKNIRLSTLIKEFNLMLPKKKDGKKDGEMRYLQRG